MSYANSRRRGFAAARAAAVERGDTAGAVARRSEGGASRRLATGEEQEDDAPSAALLPRIGPPRLLHQPRRGSCGDQDAADGNRQRGRRVYSAGSPAARAHWHDAPHTMTGSGGLLGRRTEPVTVRSLICVQTSEPNGPRFR
ncbi:unnamed protein product [Closterium sp. Naga37s-1]|nr:unnamed protein product [Closterium sp. Naga37s-1]